MQISLNPNQTTIRLVQITDAHLGDAVGDALLGMDADSSLAHVVALVKAEQGDAADVLLATGDLSNTGSVISYQRFTAATAGIARHTLWLPGNHDELPEMEQAFTAGKPLPRVARAGNWYIVMLDSHISGEVGGGLADAELKLLRQTLVESAAAGAHVLICLHHHPIDIDCAWLDQQRVNNADTFFSILDQFDHVRGVLWGHIHQEVDINRRGVRLMATPSTCIQFEPKQQDFKLDRLSPGYRWLNLHSDGRIDSEIARVAVQFDIDYDYTGGY